MILHQNLHHLISGQEINDAKDQLLSESQLETHPVLLEINYENVYELGFLIFLKAGQVCPLVCSLKLPFLIHPHQNEARGEEEDLSEFSGHREINLENALEVGQAKETLPKKKY